MLFERVKIKFNVVAHANTDLRAGTSTSGFRYDDSRSTNCPIKMVVRVLQKGKKKRQQPGIIHAVSVISLRTSMFQIIKLISVRSSLRQLRFDILRGDPYTTSGGKKNYMLNRSYCYCTQHRIAIKFNFKKSHSKLMSLIFFFEKKSSQKKY